LIKISLEICFKKKKNIRRSRDAREKGILGRWEDNDVSEITDARKL
jgi:hypothetical protein